MLIASHVLKEHPFEIRQENEVPELAAAILECGIWPRHRPLAVFWTPAGTRGRSHEFNASSQDTLLAGVTKRVKLDDGSHLNVLDDSDLVDFIHHHAFLKVTRLLSHEEIECTYWEISQARRQRNVE